MLSTDVASVAETGDDEQKGEVSSSEVKDLKASHAAGGEEECKRLLEKKCNELEDIPLNIAVTGNSGVGKSSFINAITGLKAQDKGAAPVSVTECTTKPQDYQYPSNPMLKFWDLPGVGTTLFPKATYLDEIKVDRFDFFLLLNTSRFMENDIWLVNEICKRNKKCFIVRTKVGVDISNNAQSYPDTHDEEAVLEMIRSSLIRQLEQNKCGHIPVFLIDSLELSKYDFGKLNLKLIEDFPDLKRAALVLSLQACSEEMIQLKADELRRRIFKVALLSSTAALAPIPGVSAAVDMAVVKSEAEFYFSRLNLDDESLKRYAILYSADYNELKQIVDNSLELIALETTKEGIKTASVAVPAVLVGIMHSALTTVATISLPIVVIGSLISVPLSFKGTYSSLKLVLDKYEKVAKEVTKHAANKVASAAEIKGAEATTSESNQNDGTAEKPMKSLQYGVQEESTDDSLMHEHH